MDYIRIKGDRFRVTLVPEEFFPISKVKFKKFVNKVLRSTYCLSDEEKYIREIIDALDELIESTPERVQAKLNEINETSSKWEIRYIQNEANKISKNKTRLEDNKQWFVEELERF